MMQYHFVGLNPLLTSSSTGTAYFHPVPINWDIRHPPHHAAHVAGQAVSAHQLIQLAASPRIQTLYIVSDLLAAPWVVTAHNPNGVTINDVLIAIYTSLRVPLTPYEWECMSLLQRPRVEGVFYARCEASRDFDRTRYGGIRRIDCLLHTTLFAGLSSLMFRNNRWEVVLTLSRDFSARGRIRSHPETRHPG